MGARWALAAASILTALLLQATVVGPVTFPVPVSLPALMVIVVAIYAGPGVGLALGFSTGLIADLGSDHPAGVQALCWMAAGLVAGMLGGLAVERGYGTRGVAALAALIGAVTACSVGLLLALLGSHAATIGLALSAVIPVGLTEALLGLALVPAVRALLRSQGIRAARPTGELIGRAHG
ncbi:MAG: rod shape-determining protein MreD [Frankiales bacterium]|jgi:rod shape-determining protein MreD|nr:rod shape-determining protein MreD [Frankiales bacterium]